MGLDPGGEGGAEGGGRRAHHLQGDAVRLEDRDRRPPGDPRGGAVDIQGARLDRNEGVVEAKPAGLDGAHPAMPDHVGYGAQGFDLAGRDGGVVEHPWTDRAVDPQHIAGGFQLVEQRLDVRRRGEGLESAGIGADGVVEEFGAGLGGLAIDQPGVARHDPADAPGRDAGPQQPEGGVHGRLAGAENDIAGRYRAAAARQMRQGVGRDQTHVVRDRIGRGRRGGDRGGAVRRVDRLAPDRHPRLVVGQQRDHPSVAAIVRHRTIVDPAAGEQLLTHHGAEIAADFGARRQFVQAGVDAVGILDPGPEGRGVDAVVGGRLVQGDEAVGVVPVPARLSVAVDNGDPGVAFGHEGIGEGQAHRAGAHHQIVGLKAGRSCHRVLFPPHERRITP